MTNNTASPKVPDALDEVVTQLLACGAVLSQMISGMLEFAASGRAAPDSAPIPEVAHDLIRSVCEYLRHDYSKRDLKTAARIVEKVTDSICNDIYAVNPEMMDELLAEDDEDEPAGPGHPSMN
jgi:hypothetical protein